ncbi:MAG: hypothetical protein JNM93_00010 [Bacteriovoracaceae bacterium]|nr:hypothetical protein [Bacteriovoracaceae bacterium]
MKNKILLSLTFCFLFSPETFAQKLSIGVQYVTNEFEFSDKNMSDEEKKLFLVPQAAPEYGPVVFNAALSKKLNKNTSLVGTLYVSCPIKNESSTSTTHFYNDPRNYNVNYVVADPALGIEGEFDYHSFVDVLNIQTTFAFQEIALGINRKFGRNFQLEASCGLDHRSQKSEVQRTPTEYVVFYQTETELKDDTYYIVPVARSIDSQTLGETYTQNVRTDSFNASLRASAIVNIYRSSRDKLIIALEGGAKYLVGKDVNPNVGLRLTKKL